MPARFHTPEGFARFYAPLAATSLLLTSTNPLLTAAVARSSDPLSALAGYLVAFSLSGVLYSPLLVIQQVVATRMLEGGRLAPVRRFALVIGGLFTAIAVAIAFFDPLSGSTTRRSFLTCPAVERGRYTSKPMSPAPMNAGRSRCSASMGGCAHTGIPPASRIDRIAPSGVASCVGT